MNGMTAITLRFVTSDNPISRLIRMQSGVSMPFTPSHVECLSRDGRAYVGQHMDGGMLARPIGYDAAEKAVKQKLVDLPCEQTQFDAFHDFCDSRIGEPYDWKAIFGFAAPDVHLHIPDTAICSAIMTLALRACGYFPMPLTVPAHHISPRDLMLIVSSHVQIDH
jgi:hypothetical protein